MDDKKKKFSVPEIETVDFSNEDIITMSTGTGAAGWSGEEFEDEQE